VKVANSTLNMSRSRQLFTIDMRLLSDNTHDLNLHKGLSKQPHARGVSLYEN